MINLRGASPTTNPTSSQNKHFNNSTSISGKNAVWYPAWEVQAGVTPIVPLNVDTVYLVMGKLDIVDGKPTIDGWQFSGGDEKGSIKSFIQTCNAKNVKVKLSIGGHGGLEPYTTCWKDHLTNENAEAFGDSIANFCQQVGCSGIDFDYEPNEYTQGLGETVGKLIFYTRQAAEKLGIEDFETSLDVNLANSWIGDARWISTAASGALNRINIMAYQSTVTPQVEKWLGDWKSAALTPELTVGMDSGFLGSIPDFAKYAFDNGLGTSVWLWDPAQAAASNAITKTICEVFHNCVPSSPAITAR